MNFNNICNYLQCENITRGGMNSKEYIIVNCKLQNAWGIEFNITKIPKNCINKEKLQQHKIWETLKC